MIERLSWYMTMEITTNFSVWFILMIFLGISINEGLSEGQQHLKKKTRSSAVVVGTVYCDTCFNSAFSKSPNHLIPGLIFFFLSFLVVCYIVLCFTLSYSRSCRRCFSFSGMYWRELETDFQTRSENRRTRRIQGKATVLCKQACEEDQEMLSDVAKQLTALLFHSCFRNFFFFSQTP